MDAKFDLIINTTQQESLIELPDNFDAIAGFEIDSNDADSLNGITGTDVVEIPLDDNLTFLSAAPEPIPLDPDRIAYTLKVPNTQYGEQAQGEFYILVRASGDMTFPGFALNGSFDLIINEQFMTMAVGAQLVAGFEGVDFYALNAAGVFKINADGLAGKLRLTEDTNESTPFAEYADSLGFELSMNATYDLLVNTTESESLVDLPDGFDGIAGFNVEAGDAATLTAVTGSDVAEVALDDELTFLRSTPGPTAHDPNRIQYTLRVPNTQFGQQAQGDAYTLIHATGDLIFPGVTLTGTFDQVFKTDFAIMTVSAQMTAGLDTVSIFDFTASGVLKLTTAGIAGKLALTPTVGAAEPFADYWASVGLDFDLDAQFDMLINTTLNEALIDLPDNFDAIAIYGVNTADADALNGVVDNEIVDVPLADNLTTLSATPGPTEVNPDRIQFTLKVPNTRSGQQATGEIYTITRGNGSMILPGMTLTGAFDYTATALFAVLTVDANLLMNVGGTDFFDLTAAGVFKLDLAGVAGKLRLTQTPGQPAPFAEYATALGLDVSLTGKLDLIVNTTTNEVTIELPDHFDAITEFDVSSSKENTLLAVSGSDVASVINDDKLTLLSTAPEPITADPNRIEFSLIVPNTPHDSVSLADGAGNAYVNVHAIGVFHVGKVDFDGRLNYVADGANQRIDVAFDGFVDVDILGRTVVNADAAILTDGIVARVDLDATPDATFGAAVDLNFTGQVILGVNTTNTSKTVGGETVLPGSNLNVGGRFDILGFAQARGTAAITISGSQYDFDFDGTLELGPVDVDASGLGTIRSDGFVLSMTVQPNFDVLGVFTIEGSGTVEINTTGTTRNGIPANTFRLDATNGTIRLVNALKLNTPFVLIVNNYGWTVEIGGITGSGPADKRFLA